MGMFRRVETIVLGLSVLVHAGVGWAMVSVEPREPEPPPPIVITVREVEEPEPEVEPELEPEPTPEPEPEAEPEPGPEPEPEPTPEPKPAPKSAPPPEPAPAEPAPPAAPPEFGLELGGASGADGLDVPEGNPDGEAGGKGKGGPVKKKVESKKRELASKAELESNSGCTEERIKAKPVKLAKPTYTDAARAAKIEGAVRLRLQIAADGKVGEVEVLQSLDPELDRRAIETSQAATFEPATECGKPVASSVTLSIRFSL